MRALLDVNVLIALLDGAHILHARAREWFEESASSSGWASCPITQNGCVRVMSQPGYPAALPPGAIIERLAGATGHASHEFWPDAISLLDSRTAHADRIHGPRQVTDVYLLALAVKRKGRLATFDAGIALSAVPGAAPRNIAVL